MQQQVWQFLQWRDPDHTLQDMDIAENGIVFLAFRRWPHLFAISEGLELLHWGLKGGTKWGHAQCGGVAVWRDRVYATSVDANCIEIFRQDGSFVSVLQIFHPGAIRIAESRIYVCGQLSASLFRVVVLDLEGHQLFKFSEFSANRSSFDPVNTAPSLHITKEEILLAAWPNMLVFARADGTWLRSFRHESSDHISFMAYAVRAHTFFAFCPLSSTKFKQANRKLPPALELQVDATSKEEDVQSYREGGWTQMIVAFACSPTTTVFACDVSSCYHYVVLKAATITKTDT